MSFWLWVLSGLCIWSWQSYEPIASLYGLSLLSWTSCCCWHLKSSEESNKTKAGMVPGNSPSSLRGRTSLHLAAAIQAGLVVITPFQRRDTKAGRSEARPS